MKMLKYNKTILSKVSFDRQLFEKELKKAIAFLSLREEIMELEKWCKTKFGGIYSGEINRCFNAQ